MPLQYIVTDVNQQRQRIQDNICASQRTIIGHIESSQQKCRRFISTLQLDEHQYQSSKAEYGITTTLKDVGCYDMVAASRHKKGMCTLSIEECFGCLLIRDLGFWDLSVSLFLFICFLHL